MKRRTFLQSIIAACVIPGLPMRIIPERMFTSKSALDGLFIGSRLWSQKLFDYAMANMSLTNLIKKEQFNA